MPTPPNPPSLPRFFGAILQSLPKTRWKLPWGTHRWRSPWPMPAFLAAMDPPQRNLTLAFGASVLIHAVALAIRFTPPDFLEKARERALDVILVNSKSQSKPHKAQAKAQTNLDGGGNTAEDRRAKTPLPASRKTREGRDLLEAKRRVAELEARQKEMMTRLKSDKSISADKTREKPGPVPEPMLSGVDLVSRSLAIARLQGQIARQTEEYNQRPRKKFIGARVEEYRFAQYVEDWRQKIERIGNLNYPSAAKGRLYGSLVLTVVIKANGDLSSVEVNRSSGKRVLDVAATRIVKMSAPFAEFPKSISADTDVIEITRTWTFTNKDQLSSE